MCYHCATNPSIHHHCHHVAAVSLLLSHHGVTFTVTSLRFRRCHCDVTFIVALLRCHYCSHVIAVPSLSHCCGFVVAVMVSPLSLHCRGFVVTVVVSPSHLSWFCRRCCGVAFVSVVVSSSPLRCCLCRLIVAVLLSPLWCRLRICHGFVVAVVVSPSCRLWFHRRRCGVAFVVALSRFCCCRGGAFISARSPGHRH